MRIAYLHDEQLSAESGVLSKIRAQTAEWRKRDHIVELFAMRTQESVLSANDVGKLLSHWRNAGRAIRDVTTFRPDIIYARYIKYAPRFAGALRRIAPYVIEVNTDDAAEFGLLNWGHGTYNRLTRSVFYRNAAACVAVTSELAKRCCARWVERTTVIANGYDSTGAGITDEYPLIAASDTIRLVFVGTPGHAWHGTDKVCRLSRLLPEFEFHIVGPSAADIGQLGGDCPNIVTHGRLPPRDVDRLIASCDVGISTLALHRNGMSEACPLKSRQYLSAGLPMLTGYIDPDIPKHLKFVLNIGNHEDNVSASLEDVRKFCVQARELDRSEIRAFARRAFDSRIKETERLDFLTSVLTGVRRHRS